MMLLIFTIITVGLVLYGTPIAPAIFVGGIIYLFISGQDVALVAEHAISGLYATPLLLAIPMFIFAANIMNSGDITNRLVALGQAIVGRIPGGLAHVNVFVSVIFSGISGSAVADAAGPGQTLTKMMTKDDRFDLPFAAAVTGASSIIGPIIPPSIPLLFYAMISSTSVGALFFGGILPGLLLASGQILVIWVIAKRRGYPVDAAFDFKNVLRAVRRAFLPLLMPVILLGGIYSGIVTATEAAAVAAVYALLLSIFIYREMGIQQFNQIVTETVKTTSTVMILVAAAFFVNYVITAESVPQMVAEYLMSFDFTPTSFLIVINVVFLLLGAFLDVTALLLVMVPLVLPMVYGLEINPVYFGVLITINIMIGLITPPYGLVLMILSSAAKVQLSKLFVEILPFVGIAIVCLILLILFPQIVLWLPQQFGY